MKTRWFTQAELGRYDGQNGVPIFIAYRGIVYDVSNSYQWRGGMHQVMHRAGDDLSGEIALAPHGADLLKKFPVVGMIKSAARRDFGT